MSTSQVLRQIRRAVESYQSFLIASPENLDADSVCSQLALRKILSTALLSDLPGKGDATIVLACASPQRERFRYLPGIELLRSGEEIRGQAYDVAFVVDCGDRRRLGSLLPLVEQSSVIINIDHHVPDPDSPQESWGDIRWFDSGAASVTEMLYAFVRDRSWAVPLDADLAIYIYVGLLTDTGSFRFASTSPRTHRIVAALLRVLSSSGVDFAVLGEQASLVKSLASAKLLGAVLSDIHLECAGRVAWAVVSMELRRAAGAGAITEGIVDQLCFIDGVEVAILFTEQASNSQRVTFRARSGHNVLEIAKRFGGGGHARAAGCTVPGSLQQVQEVVLIAVRQEGFCTLQRRDGGAARH